MDYGPAPEANDVVTAWLDKHEAGFGHFIDGAFVGLQDGKLLRRAQPGRRRRARRRSRRAPPRDVDARGRRGARRLPSLVEPLRP